MRERKIPLDQRSMLRARARWAQAEDINDVVRLREAVLGGDILRPLCCGTRLNFDGGDENLACTHGTSFRHSAEVSRHHRHPPVRPKPDRRWRDRSSYPNPAAHRAATARATHPGASIARLHSAQSPNTSTMWLGWVNPFFIATWCAHASTASASSSTVRPQLRQMR
jgi:hypothetical protein